MVRVVHLWVLFGSDFGDIVGLVGFDFAGFLLVICGFFFGSGGWWVMGSEAGVVCLSFVAFWTVEVVVTGGFSGRETKEVVKIRERKEMGENRYDFEIYYFIV